MSAKEDILNRYKRNVGERHAMPSLDDIDPITYPDPLLTFKMMCQNNSANLLSVEPGRDINEMIRECYPQAKVIASAVEGIKADLNPNTVKDASDLNGTDVGVIEAQFGVAENGCMWVEQDVKEKAICFISENLVILLPKDKIFNNMHEAYRHLSFGKYNFGTFIAGPSKTADIAQVLVIGAQAARSCTVLLV